MATQMEAGRKSVVVTGGGSGIGLAMTRHFASEGHLVAILDVNTASGLKVAAELASEYPNAQVTFKKCDVSSWKEQAAVFKEVFEEHGGKIDVVLANAGISEQGETSSVDLKEETPSEPRLGAINVNLIGVIYCESGAPSRFEVLVLTPARQR
jgi:NAD(P)-dependent dehydrogenase (short-subunit alcohol dehydrogenase family)